MKPVDHWYSRLVIAVHVVLVPSTIRELAFPVQRDKQGEIDAPTQIASWLHLLASKYKELAARFKKDTRELSKEEDEELHRELYALAPRDATVDDLVSAISHAVKRIGIDHVGISSDFNHGGGIVGWKDESEALNVTAELLRRGYAEDQIAKLWGGNFLRVFRQVENVAKQIRLADSRRH
jgi:microsomal dipeptidase-like Zn-dependent dipeptidase